MAGRGPAPKPSHLRQRHNKVATRALAEVPEVPLAERYPLPIRVCTMCPPLTEPKAKGKAKPKPCSTCNGTRIVPWHDFTVAWWREVWAGPFAGEYIPTDVVGGLYILARLYDSYWYTGDMDIAKEIRLREGRMGLDVMARRGLQWEVKKTPAAKQPTAVTPSQAPRVADPRKVLFMEAAGGSRA